MIKIEELRDIICKILTVYPKLHKTEIIKMMYVISNIQDVDWGYKKVGRGWYSDKVIEAIDDAKGIGLIELHTVNSDYFRSYYSLGDKNDNSSNIFYKF